MIPLNTWLIIWAVLVIGLFCELIISKEFEKADLYYVPIIATGAVLLAIAINFLTLLILHIK